MTILYRGKHVFAKAKIKSTLQITSGDVQVDSGDVAAGGGMRAIAKISGGDGLNLASGNLNVRSGNLAVGGTTTLAGVASFTAGMATPGKISGGDGLNLASGSVNINSGNLVVGGTTALRGNVINTVTMASGNLAVQSGDLTVGGHSDGKVFVANHFLCPAPGTDWTPSSGGILLGIGKASKYAWMPLDFLKVGDEITGYKLVGSFEGSVTSATIDSALVRVDLGGSGPVRTVPASGSMVQGVASSTWVSNSVTLNAAEVVAVNKHYQIEIQGTTSVSQQATVYQAEVTVNRKV